MIQRFVPPMPSSTAVYEFMLAVTMTLAHTSRRHSSFLSSGSGSEVGHIGVAPHAGASPETEGQVCEMVRVRQLHAGARDRSPALYPSSGACGMPGLWGGMGACV